MARNNESHAKGHSGLIIAILVLVIVQAVLTLVLFVTVSTKAPGSVDVSDIETKVTRMDTWFSNNVDGYATGGTGTAGAGQQQAAPPSKVDPSSINMAGEPTEGSSSATVTIVEFSDYECPFCGRFYTESYGQIKTEYIDTGKVKLVYKDFPLSFHPTAKPAAIAANCVFAQGGSTMYFKYHNKLFENQQALTATNLRSWAVDVGADGAKYDKCIVDPAVAAEIDADIAEGGQLGVSGTPSFFINGELVVGAQPYSVIKGKIDAALAGN